MRHLILKTAFTLSIFFVCCSVFSQKEANTWYFENGLGIDFNQCPPQPIYGGDGGTWENSCAISDPVTGELLFYTNSISVFNRNHQVMMNGANLLGNTPAGFTTSQVCVVPHPNKDSSHLYFVFTLFPQSTSTQDSLKYHVVDMSKNWGLGAVVKKRLNLLPGPLTEKVVAIRASDKKSFRVIVHGSNTNDFFVYKIDQQGLHFQPVKNSVGKVNSVVTQFAVENVGCLIASPDGTKLCYLNLCDKDIQLYKFDYNSGVISDYLNIKTPNPLYKPSPVGFKGGFYGGSFSPNSNFLYAGTMASNNSDEIADIYQFDVSVWDQPRIENSVYTVVRAGLSVSGQARTYTNFKHMKLGPNGKLYIGVSKWYTGVNRPSNPDAVTFCLPVISFPDLPKRACQYNSCGISYNPASVGARYNSSGPPNGLYQTWSLNDLFELNDYAPKGRERGKKQMVTCQVATVKPLTKVPLNNAVYRWSDGSIGDSMRVTRNKKYHWVDIITEGCDTIRDSFEMTLRNWKAGLRTTLCMGAGLTLRPLSDTSGVMEYKWSNLALTPSIQVVQPDMYAVTLSNNCDSIVDVFIVTGPKRKLGSSVSMCQKRNPWLKPISNVKNLMSRKWSDGQGSDSIRFNGPGIYWVDQISACDTVRDSFTVAPRLRKKGRQLKICLGRGKTLRALSDTSSAIDYWWSNGSEKSSVLVSTPGHYWLDIISECDTVRDSFELMPRIPAKGKSADVCLGDQKMLWPLSDTLNHQGFRWNSGGDQVPLLTRQAGTYLLSIHNECATITDTIHVTPRQSVTGGRRHFCPGQKLTPLTPFDKESSWLWNTGRSDSVLYTTNPGFYWLKMTSDCFTRTDSFDVSTLRAHGLFDAPDAWLCGRAVAYLLNTDTSLHKVYWKHGPEGALIELYKPGTYPFTIVSKDLCRWDSGSANVIRVPNQPSFIETAFSPDHNGINDVFPRESLMEKLTIEEISVFDRWGELIYSSPDVPWDGTLRGETCQEGVYYCRIVYRNCDNIQRHWYGTFTLLK